MNSSNHLGLFAKYWSPGNVKTRLAATLGNPRAASVYLQFLTHLLRQLESVSDRRIIAFQPTQQQQQFSELAAGQWELDPQANGDLGWKLQSFFASVFERPSLPAADATKVVVIGSDCPLIDAELIDQAFGQLNDHAVVIGPSSDGGYYLVGMREYIPWIFEDVDWSTERVFEQTIGKLQERQIEFGLLVEMNDIDDWDDLKILLNELKGRGNDRPFQSLLVGLNEALDGFDVSVPGRTPQERQS